MPDLDWNLIRSFAAVAETGSLSAAARRLSASQPTLGRHIAELEAALDVTLFRRGRTGYELTDSGIALFDRARAVRNEATAFERLASGAVETIAKAILPFLLVEIGVLVLLTAFPDISLWLPRQMGLMGN